MSAHSGEYENTTLTELAKVMLDQLVLLGVAQDASQDGWRKRALQKAKTAQAHLLHDLTAHIWRSGLPGASHQTDTTAQRVSALSKGSGEISAFHAVGANGEKLLAKLHEAVANEDLGGHLRNFLLMVLSRCETLIDSLNVDKPPTAKKIESDPRILNLRAGRPLHILLVEDNPSVAAVTTEMLEHFGWRVTRAEDSAAALRFLSPEVDILLSDVVMPGERDGLALAKEARKLRPKMPIVLSTGYTERVAREARDAGIPLLSKPYGLDALSAAIEAARPVV